MAIKTMYIRAKKKNRSKWKKRKVEGNKSKLKAKTRKKCSLYKQQNNM